MDVTTNVDRGSDRLDVGLFEEDFLGSVADELQISLSKASSIDEDC